VQKPPRLRQLETIAAELDCVARRFSIVESAVV
jgi:hypothetical protein